MKITKEDLVNAFKEYNNEFVTDPKGFISIDGSDECAELQANKILSYLPANQDLTDEQKLISRAERELWELRRKYDLLEIRLKMFDDCMKLFNSGITEKYIEPKYSGKLDVGNSLSNYLYDNNIR